MVRLPVSCAAVGRDGRTTLMVVRSVDLSAGGVKVVTEHSLVPGNRVRVVFRVDDDTNARLDATVLRVEPLGDGLRRYAIDFDPVDRTVEQRLMKTVYAAEQVNAGRHRHVRMTVWQAMRVTGANGSEYGAHALQISADDAQIITSHIVRPRASWPADRDAGRRPRASTSMPRRSCSRCTATCAATSSPPCSGTASTASPARPSCAARWSRSGATSPGD